MIRQYGAIAYDVGEDGALRILLITSRKTQRWIIPRGNPIRGLSPAQCAAQEAYEEAGVTGPVSTAEIGTYRYQKHRKNGTIVLSNVHVFALRVTAQAARFPERHQRQTQWFGRAEAAAAVDEPGLRDLIERFAPPSEEQQLPTGRFGPVTLRRFVMDDREGVTEKETVIVERGSGGGVIAAIALLILVVAVLAYLGMLPF